MHGRRVVCDVRVSRCAVASDVYVLCGYVEHDYDYDDNGDGCGGEKEEEHSWVFSSRNRLFR